MEVDYTSKQNTTIELNDNFELQIFNSNSEDLQYLIITNGRHYKINQGAYNLIRIIEKQITAEEIAFEYSQIQKQNYTAENICLLIERIIAPLGIIKSSKSMEKAKPKSILWFKLPVFSESFLIYITKFLKYLFEPNILKILLCIIVFCHYFMLVNHFPDKDLINMAMYPYFTFIITLILFGSGIIHEFGHVSACRYYGVQNKEIGLGMYLMFPVLYSNVSNAWKVSGNKRAIIDIAGIYFQYLFNILLFCLYFLLDKNIVFIYAVKLICIQSILTLNPFFRFDGYWLATDLLGIPNLRKHSSEYIQNIIKKYVFRKNISQINIGVKPIAKYLFLTYTILSNLFFIYFTILIISGLPEKMIELPTVSKEAVNIIYNSYQASDWKNVGISLYQFFIYLFLLLLGCYFIILVTFRIYKSMKSVIIN